MDRRGGGRGFDENGAAGFDGGSGIRISFPLCGENEDRRRVGDVVEIEEMLEGGSDGFEGVEVGDVGLSERVPVADRGFEEVRPLSA